MLEGHWETDESLITCQTTCNLPFKHKFMYYYINRFADLDECFQPWTTRWTSSNKTRWWKRYGLDIWQLNSLSAANITAISQDRQSKERRCLVFKNVRARLLAWDACLRERRRRFREGRGLVQCIASLIISDIILDFPQEFMEPDRRSSLHTTP